MKKIYSKEVKQEPDNLEIAAIFFSVEKTVEFLNYYFKKTSYILRFTVIAKQSEREHRLFTGVKETITDLCFSHKKP